MSSTELEQAIEFAGGTKCEHPLQDGRKLWTRVCYGKVIAEREWNETHVYSTETPVTYATSQGVAYGTAQKVRSQNIQRQKIWVRDLLEGIDREFELPEPIGVLDGHEVVIMWGAVEGHEGGPYFTVLQLSTGKEYHFQGDNWFKSAGIYESAKKKACNYIGMGAFWSSIALYAYGFRSLFFIALAASVVLFFFIADSIEARRVKKEVRSIILDVAAKWHLFGEALKRDRQEKIAGTS